MAVRLLTLLPIERDLIPRTGSRVEWIHFSVCNFSYFFFWRTSLSTWDRYFFSWRTLYEVLSSWEISMLWFMALYESSFNQWNFVLIIFIIFVFDNMYYHHIRSTGCDFFPLFRLLKYFLDFFLLSYSLFIWFGWFFFNRSHLFCYWTFF